jgi:mannose-6-phosphate isomerase-like protein (cupin superfamily)
MHLYQLDPRVDKGWYAGPWNSDLPVSIGYANTAIRQPHWHRQVTEIYLLARGSAEMRIDDQIVSLSAGDVILIHPGEVHTFLSCSPDYLHFVMHVPGLAGDAARADKVLLTGENPN